MGLAGFYRRQIANPIPNGGVRDLVWPGSVRWLRDFNGAQAAAEEDQALPPLRHPVVLRCNDPVSR